MTCHIDLNLLYRLYVIEKKASWKIADILHVSEPTIYYRLRENGWIRSRSEARNIRYENEKIKIDEDLLYRLYVVEQKTLQQVADAIGHSITLVCYRLDDLGILLRSASEAARIKEITWYWGSTMVPNEKETMLYDIVERLFPGEFGLNVNGEIQTKLGLYFGRRKPDILSVNGRKQIILHNGCYYHACEGCGYGDMTLRGGKTSEWVHKDDLKILQIYKDLGYAVLIIWEHEWDDIEQIMIRIRDFVENPEYSLFANVGKGVA